MEYYERTEPTLVDQSRKSPPTDPSYVDWEIYCSCYWYELVHSVMSSDRNTRPNQTVLTSNNKPNMLDEPGLLHAMSIQHSKRVKCTNPPFNQIPHGRDLLTSDVNDPFAFSTPTKNSVSFGWPWRCTGMFPAKRRPFPTTKVTLGRGCVTWKSRKY